MKILIGITQDLDTAKNTIAAHHKGLGTSTEAGPFKTHEEALNWQDFMMNRRNNYEEVTISSETDSDAYWFGITFESSEIH